MAAESFDVDSLEAVVFDVLGTLVDDEGTFARVAVELAGEAGLTESEPLRLEWSLSLERLMSAVVSGQAPWRPHRELVRDSAMEAMQRLGGRVSTAAADLALTVDESYPAWPDVADATAALVRRHLVAGLSNGDLGSLARLGQTQHIGWNAVLSTGAVHTFKPAPAAYRYAIEALDLDPGRTLFVAAHTWDLRAAAGHGFRTAFVARPGAEPPRPADRFDLVVADLAELTAIAARADGVQTIGDPPLVREPPCRRVRTSALRMRRAVASGATARRTRRRSPRWSDASGRA